MTDLDGRPMSFDLSAVSDDYFRARLMARYFVLAMAPLVLILALAGYFARASPPSTSSAWAVTIGVFVFAGALAIYLGFAGLVHMARGAKELQIDDGALTLLFPAGRLLVLPWSNPRFRLVVHDHQEFAPRSKFPIRILFSWHPFTALTPTALEAIQRAAEARGLRVTVRTRSTISYGRLTEIRVARSG